MRFDRMMWLCGALVVVFGLPLAVLEDIFWRTLSGGLAVLSLGLFALAMVGDGLVRGKIRIQFSVIDRAAQPRTYWAAMALVTAAGLGVMVSAVWVMFFKAG